MLIGASGFCVLRLFFAFPAIVVFGTAAALAFLPANSRLLRWPQIWIGLTALTCLLPAVIPTLMIDINDSYSSLSYQTLAGMLFASAVASMSKMRTVVDSAFSRLIIMSGGWSYSLYIMHYPLLIGLYSCAVYFSPKSILVQSGVIFFPLFFTINILCFAAARLLERPKYFARQLKHVLKMQAVAHHL
jgi:peptidoglycan/LPS O-acetylase OafA/YrhL